MWINYELPASLPGLPGRWRHRFRCRFRRDAATVAAGDAQLRALYGSQDQGGDGTTISQ